MKNDQVTCAICGEQRQDEDGWFVLVENRWTDRLKILVWNEALASADETHLACGAAHVQQLVVHWMTMGSLEYPFAQGPRTARITKPRCVKEIPRAEADLGGTRVVGELAVHRESLERILQESPESLAAILEALTSALTGKDYQKSGNAQDFEENRELCVLSEV
jgi:hypothetical protein